MNELIISEGCFGPSVYIDGDSLRLEEKEYDWDEEKVKIHNEKADKAQDKLIQELILVKSKLGIDSWSQIAEIVARYGKFDFDEANSDEGSSCDQCGNYNTRSIYNKKKEGSEFHQKVNELLESAPVYVDSILETDIVHKGIIKEDRDISEEVIGYSINDVVVHRDSEAFAEKNIGKEIEYNLNFDGYRQFGAFKKEFYKKAIIITK